MNLDKSSRLRTLADPPSFFDRLSSAASAFFGRSSQKSLPNFDPHFFSSLLGNQGGATEIQKFPGMNHSVTYSCCRAIINPYNQIHHELFQVDGSGQPKTDVKPVFDHQILRLMDSPNPYMSGTNFFELIWWFLLLPTPRTPGGQAFVVGGKPTNFKRGEIPSELWVFSDRVMEARLDVNGVLVGWRLTVPGFKSSMIQDYTLEEVIRINFLNPYDLSKGLSPLFAAMNNVTLDAQATEFNTRFLANNASMSGIVSPTEELSEEEIKLTKAMIEQQVQGSQNAGRTWFLPVAMKYERMQATQEDMAYSEMEKSNTSRIISCFGLNKFALGQYEDINYATALAARRQVWENAILPGARLIWKELNDGWLRWLRPFNLRIRGDLTKVEALKEDLEKQVKVAQGLVAIGVPAAAAIRQVGIPLDTSIYPWLEEEPKRFSGLSFGGESEDPPKPEPVKMIQIPVIKTPTAHRIDVKTDEREKLSQEYTQKLFIPGEKDLLPVVNRFLVGQRNRYLDQVDEVFAKSPDVKKLTVSAFELPEKSELNRIMESFAPPLTKQVKRTLEQVKRELRKIQKLDAEASEDEIRKFLKKRLLGLSEVNHTTFDGVEDKLSQILAKGIKEELTVQEMKKAIKEGVGEYFDDTRRGGAPTIARTETAVVSSGARFEAFDSAGIKRHEWLTAKDDRVRESHSDEDGHVVTIGDDFPITGLEYPSDPDGPVEEVVNCRCIALPVEED